MKKHKTQPIFSEDELAKPVSGRRPLTKRNDKNGRVVKCWQTQEWLASLSVEGPDVPGVISFQCTHAHLNILAALLMYGPISKKLLREA
jgi:hypothetical protein